MRKRPARSEDYFTEHPETIDKLLRWVATSRLFPSAKKYLAAFRSSWRFQIPQDTLFSSSDTPARLRALDAPQAQHEPLRRRLLREPPRRGDAGRISPPPCRVFSRAKGCLAFGRPDRPAGGTGRPRIRRDDPGGAAAGTARSFHYWKFFFACRQRRQRSAISRSKTNAGRSPSAVAEWILQRVPGRPDGAVGGAAGGGVSV